MKEFPGFKICFDTKQCSFSLCRYAFQVWVPGKKITFTVWLNYFILFFPLFGPADSRLLAISAVLSCLGQQYILGFTNIDVENGTSGLPLPPPPLFLPQIINISSFASLAWLIFKTCCILYLSGSWGSNFNATSNSKKGSRQSYFLLILLINHFKAVIILMSWVNRSLIKEMGSGTNTSFFAQVLCKYTSVETAQ